MDCLEGMKEIPDRSIDMILCDLPYGTTSCRWDTVIPFESLWEHYERVIKDNGVIALTAQTPFDKVLGCSNLKLLRYEWVWVKAQGTGSMNSNRMPLKKHENILIFYKYLPKYNPQFSEGNPYVKIRSKIDVNSVYGKTGTIDGYVAINSGKRYPTSVLHFKRDSIRRLHPTQKPVALFEYLIKTYTDKEDLVLDNCIGSGTTAIACINTGRNYIGFEIDKKYFTIAEKRIKDASAQLRFDMPEHYDSEEERILHIQQKLAFN